MLPEGPLRKRLAATRKDIRDTDDFGILAAAGEDLPGAVKVLPANLANLTAAARAYGVTGGADNLEIGVPEAAAEGAAAVSGLQDRRPGRSTHMEDACQLQTLMPKRKYGEAKYFVNLLRVLDRLSVRGIEDVRQFFIRQAVNTLIGNSDAHLKNFSVIYHNGIKPELSPAYDIVCVTALPNFRGFATNVAIDQRQRAETLDTYKAVAKAARIAERVAIAAVRTGSNRRKTFGPKRCMN